ncbi:MAG: transcription antitermination factor NusB [bacterium]|nr:transcription antitermination factor NusB [bacterium]
MQTRRKAREQAIQFLYQLDITDTPLNNGLSVYCEQNPDSNDKNRFMIELLTAVVQHHPEIDAMIRDTVKHWNFDRIAVVDRNILRVAIAELLYFDTIPVNVTINEAVELAKKFSTKDSGKFVNGILDTIVKSRKIHKPI